MEEKGGRGDAHSDVRALYWLVLREALQLPQQVLCGGREIGALVRPLWLNGRQELLGDAIVPSAGCNNVVLPERRSKRAKGRQPAEGREKGGERVRAIKVC